MKRLLSFKNDLVMNIGVNQMVLKTVLINEMLNEYFLSVILTNIEIGKFVLICKIHNFFLKFDWLNN